MAFQLEGKLFGTRHSPYIIGERMAKTEAREIVKQLFLDMPRSEPRVLPDDEWIPQNLNNSDVIKDKEIVKEEDMPHDGLVFFRPVQDNENPAFTVEVLPGELVIRADSGECSCCFPDQSTIRIKGHHMALRFFAPLMDHEAAVDRQDQTYQVCFEATGECLFVPLRGEAVMNNPWSLWHGGSQRLFLQINPDDEGILDMAIQLAPSSAEKSKSYPVFEECLSRCRDEYTAWLEEHKLPHTPESLSKWIDLPKADTAVRHRKQLQSMLQAYQEDICHRKLLPAESKTPLLSSIGEFDLRAVPFSRRGSFLCVLENDEDRQLYLSVSRSPEMWAQRLHLIRLNPVIDGIPLPYEYEAEPAEMTIRTCGGVIRLAFDNEARLHIQGNVRLQLSFALQANESCYPRGNQAWEVEYAHIGHMLFVTQSGAVSCGAPWRKENRSDSEFTMELIPASESRSFDAIVENSYEHAEILTEYKDFKTSAEETLSDYQQYSKRYPAVPQEYASRTDLAAWVVWSHTLGPSGRIKSPVVYMTRTQFTRAFGWQQSFHAMSAVNDIHEAWKLLLAMFGFMDERGQLPDSGGDIGATYRVTKPALQGLATLYILNRCDVRELTREECSDLYYCMTRFTDWWLLFRDRNRSGLPQYFHADESPGEYCSVFRDGLPLYAADVASFVALMAEACGKLAGMIGLPEEEKQWYEVSKNIIGKIMEKCWDGSRFQGRVVETDTFVNSKCVLNMLPVMLGERLPKEVLDMLIKRLSDEKEYLGKDGVTVESMEDIPEQHVPRGTVVYLSTLMAVCLMNAGKSDLAKELARRALQLPMRYGFAFLNVQPKGEDEPSIDNMPREKQPSATSKWASWPCCCFFILADILNSKS